MSELARRDRLVKRRWAAPGGSHDRLIGALKIALPALIGVVLAYLALAPLEKRQEISFLFDKSRVDVAEERLRVERAEYRGRDARGRPFLLSARSAVQESSAEPVLEIRDMLAQLLLDEGPARLRAERARYDLQEDQVDVLGPIVFTAADGYRLSTRDVLVDLRDRTLVSDGPVEGRMPLGRFSAGQLRVNLDERRVVLSERARLHIVQGGLR